MTGTSIEWTDCTINPIRFAHGHYCQKISPGCANCYASRMQSRFGNPEFGGTGSKVPPMVEAVRDDNDGALWLDSARLEKVLRRRKPARIFWLDMSDLFGEWVPDEWIDRCFAVMAATHWHTHQVLTKRADRARDYLAADGRPMRLAAALAHLGSVIEAERIPGDWSLWAPTIAGLRNQEPRVWPLRNVWLGVSVEDQQRADERIPLLLQTPAAVRFLSCEPLLGSVDLRAVPYLPATGRDDDDYSDTLGGQLRNHALDTGIDWVIVGGESGPGARPCGLAWLRSIVAQCRDAGVPCFLKQLGSVPVMDEEEWRALPRKPLLSATRHERAPGGTVALATGDRKGGDPQEWPADLRVRQWPAQGATT